MSDVCIPADKSASIPTEPSISPRMLFWAFRYALGRQSYAVDDVATEMARCVVRLTPSERHTILLEIAEARQSGNIGMACDDASWNKVERAILKATTASAVGMEPSKTAE